MSASKKSALSFIFITLLLDVTGICIIMPVLPQLIKQLINGSISEASQWSGFLTFAYALTQLLCAPIVGNLSDHYGRRPVLLMSLFGFGVDFVFLALAPTIWWLFLGRIIAGAFGASLTTASAYISDVSTNENRAKNFGMIGAAFGLGFIIGPAIGGLLGNLGPRIPFVAAAVLAFSNVIFGYFVLPESLLKENRRLFEWKRANPLGSLRLLKKYKSIIGLVLSLVCLTIASHAIYSTWSFINIERFGWNNTLIGASLTTAGLLIALVQGVLIRFINPKLGNAKSIYLGLALYATGFLLFSLSSQSWMMFIFLIPYCCGGIAGPALQSMIAGAVKPNEQGELQGTLTTLMSLTSIIGPLLMTNLFAYFSSPAAPFHFPNAPFIAGALLMAVSYVIVSKTIKSKASMKKNAE